MGFYLNITSPRHDLNNRGKVDTGKREEEEISKFVALPAFVIFN